MLNTSRCYPIVPNGFLAIIEWSATRGSDSPSVFTADTRNVYSCPGIRLDKVMFGSLHLPAGTQRPVDRNYKIIQTKSFDRRTFLLSRIILTGFSVHLFNHVMT